MKLIELRRIMKKRKPVFNRQDSHKKKRLRKGWRRPRGLQSKMRLNLKGYCRCVSKGYRSPKKVRGFDKSGVNAIKVSCVKDLEQVKDEGVIIKKVGLRKKIEIVKKAVEKGITIINIKDVNAFLNEVEEKMKKKKAEKVKEAESKEKKKKAKEKAAQDKKKKDEEEKVKEAEKTEEEIAKEKKEEKDKVLIKKEG